MKILIFILLPISVFSQYLGSELILFKGKAEATISYTQKVDNITLKGSVHFPHTYIYYTIDPLYHVEEKCKFKISYEICYVKLFSFGLRHDLCWVDRIYLKPPARWNTFCVQTSVFYNRLYGVIGYGNIVYCSLLFNTKYLGLVAGLRINLKKNGQSNRRSDK